MKFVLRNLAKLALALAISTGAAGLVKALLRRPVVATQVNDINEPIPLAPAVERLPLPDAPLRIAYKPQPRRTEAAIRHNITGVVKLEVFMPPSGLIEDIQVLKGLPGGLTKRAIDAATKIGYNPAVVDGQFVGTWQMIEFKFDAAHDQWSGTY